DLASGLYLACAAVGLAFIVGIAGLPSLAQGAFVAVGAVVAAHLLAAGGAAAAAAGLRRVGGGGAGGPLGAAVPCLPPPRPPAGGLRGGDVDRLLARRVRAALDHLVPRRVAGARRHRRADDGAAL